MTFEEWYANSFPSHMENYHAPVMKELARGAWNAATKAERERCLAITDRVRVKIESLPDLDEPDLGANDWAAGAAIRIGSIIREGT